MKCKYKSLGQEKDFPYRWKVKCLIHNEIGTVSGPDETRRWKRLHKRAKNINFRVNVV